ncbi:MAG: TldD/PmbA family protein [Nitrososphaeria archaeon]|nr:TldD/PmbA family protein [Nitrososphaeria archaeon]
MREQLTSSKNRTTSLDAQKAIKIALKNGAAYCDARIETYKEHGIVLENGQQEQSSASYDTGIGVRVLYDGAWGFFSTTDESKLEDGIMSAIKSAKATPKKNKVVLAQIPIDKKTINYPVRKNPEISELEKIARDCHDIMRRYKISKDIISALVCQTSKTFESSEGAQIIQSYTDCTVDLVAIARSSITQSINSTEGGRGGLETLDSVLESAKEIASKSIELLDAKPPKEQKTTLVMNPDFVALLTHEILGHPSEADRVLGKEMAWAGGAWWAGKIGQKIGSESLNVIDDPTIPGSLGWYEYDDEGVRAQKKKLVQNGILTEHMHSRETASIFDSAPNAGMRATSYQFMPLIRMACTCIGPGKYNPEEIVRGVKDGYYVSNMKVPSIDMKRHNWSISAQYANKIEDGEIKELVRDVIIVGVAPEFFSSIDACGNDFTVRPITNCGKGDPMQQMKMGNGGPTIRGIATIRGAG